MLSAGVGYRLNAYMTVKVEFSAYDLELVRGMDPGLRRLARDRSFVAIGLSARF